MITTGFFCSSAFCAVKIVVVSVLLFFRCYVARWLIRNCYLRLCVCLFTLLQVNDVATVPADAKATWTNHRLTIDASLLKAAQVCSCVRVVMHLYSALRSYVVHPSHQYYVPLLVSYHWTGMAVHVVLRLVSAWCCKCVLCRTYVQCGHVLVDLMCTCIASLAGERSRCGIQQLVQPRWRGPSQVRRS
jgi:hypothetical protein